MRHHWTAIAILLPLLAGCGTEGDEGSASEEQKKVAQLQRELDRVRKQAGMKDQYIRSVTRNINEIESRLDSVTRAQVSVSKIIDTNPETGLNQSQAQRMLDDITAMRDALTRSKGQVRNLREAVRSSRYRITELEQLVTTLHDRVAQKDSQIVALTSRVQGLEETVSVQQRQIEDQRRRIEEQERLNWEQNEALARQERELHTAYYEYGTADVLEREGLVQRRGGVLGMGRSVVLTAGYNENKENYSEVDLRITGQILVNHRAGEKVGALLPERVASSYRLERGDDGTVVKIVNADVFWRDKYLIVLLQD